MATTITAGDLSNPAIISSDTTGAVVIQTGAAGAKVNALTISADGVVKPLDSAWPAFRAFNSSVTSLPTATFTKIALQSESFDTANAFDPTTNYRFQPSVAGYYQINGAVSLASTVSAVAAIVKTGAYVAYGQYATALTVVVSDIVFMNGSTDYVELWASQSAGSTVNTLPGSANTYFSGVLVRAV